MVRSIESVVPPINIGVKCKPSEPLGEVSEIATKTVSSVPGLLGDADNVFREDRPPISDEIRYNHILNDAFLDVTQSNLLVSPKLRAGDDDDPLDDAPVDNSVPNTSKINSSNNRCAKLLGKRRRRALTPDSDENDLPRSKRPFGFDSPNSLISKINSGLDALNELAAIDSWGESSNSRSMSSLIGEIRKDVAALVLACRASQPVGGNTADANAIIRENIELRKKIASLREVGTGPLDHTLRTGDNGNGDGPVNIAASLGRSSDDIPLGMPGSSLHGITLNDIADKVAHKVAEIRKLNGTDYYPLPEKVPSVKPILSYASVAGRGGSSSMDVEWQTVRRKGRDKAAGTSLPAETMTVPVQNIRDQDIKRPASTRNKLYGE